MSLSSRRRLFAIPYSYSPLSTSAFEIRLLTVNSATRPGGLLSVYMLEYRLAVTPPYITISYTWGRPAPELPDEWDDAASTQPILLNGREFRVRYNLHCLLEQLANGVKLEGVAYWIDALCIDQANKAEKNTVVSRMTEIYAGGQLNFVWLGPHATDGSTRIAFAKISSLGKSWDERSEVLQKTLIHDDQLAAYAEIVRAEFPRDEGMEPWDAIQSVWSRSWWQRTWVLQEASVSKYTTVMCGDSTVPWNAIANTYLAIWQHHESLQMLQVPNKDALLVTLERLISPGLVTPVINMIQCVGRVAAFADREEHASLLSNLGFMRSMSSTDERDKVYAAFGISDPTEITGVDYTLPVRDVYTNVAQQSFRALKGYAILSSCRFPLRGSGRLGLPTWVPDWADRRPRHHDYLPFIQKGLVIMNEDIKNPVYNAAGGSTLENMRFEDDGLTLVVPGLLQDTLTFVSSTMALDTIAMMNLPSAGTPQSLLLGNSGDGHNQRPPQTGEAIVDNVQWLREWAAHLSRDTANLDWQSWIRAIDWTFRPQNSDSQFDIPRYVLTGETLREAYLRTLLADVSLTGSGLKEERLKYHGVVKIRERVPYDNFLLRLHGRRLAVTQYGLLALVPAEAREGDIVTIVEGAELPFLLRVAEHRGLEFVGPCYVHGIMDGQVWRGKKGTGTSTLYELRIV